MENENKRGRFEYTPVIDQQLSDEKTFDLYEVFYRIIEKWRQIILTALVCAVVFLFYTIRFIPATYNATSKLYVIGKRNAAINVSDLQLSNYLAKDYIEVFKTWNIHETVLSRLNLNYSYKKVRDMISITNPIDTRILYITATSTDPQEASDLANMYAEVASEFIAQKMDTIEPSLFEEALVPSAPSSPNKTKNTMMGFILGALLATMFIVIRYLLDDYIKTTEDISRYFGLPTLGIVMLEEKKENKKN